MTKDAEFRHNFCMILDRIHLRKTMEILLMNRKWERCLEKTSKIIAKNEAGRFENDLLQHVGTGSGT